MEQKHFKIIDGNKTYPVSIDTILCCEARTVRTVVHTTEGKEYLHDRNIGTMIKDSGYDPRLIRTHKSVIVNIRQVEYLEKTKQGKFAVMKGRRRVPISRRNYDEIEKLLFGIIRSL
jgi:DNA-binding LytR/AlgR family response regulator